MGVIGLIISCALAILLITYLIRDKNRSQLQDIFIINTVLIAFWCIMLLMQIYFIEHSNINPIFFEYFIYIAACFLPVSIFFTGLIFANTKIHFKKKYIILFIIPIITLFVLWSNNAHHLFYVNYSTNMNDTIFGIYFYIYSLYSYILYFFGLFYLLKYSIKNSGFFSKQALLFIVATLIPIVTNVLGALHLMPSSIYLTPITFTITILLSALAIFKFKFLRSTPIALQRIVDKISDCYIVLNEDNIITDFNETFLTVFGVSANYIRNREISNVLQKFNEPSVNIDELLIILDKVKTANDTFYYSKHFENVDKYFNIEINDIRSNGNYVGTLILFKDITQHVEDMETIKQNQDMLVEKERLASLGQLVGGIAHNLKTPIMSIAGATEGLNDLIKEYDSSIGDSEVTNEDHHAIAHDMSTWIEKIKTHTSYMSDIITAVKGQAVTLNEEEEEDNFTIQELIKRVNILMRHELKKSLIDMNVNINTDELITLNGNVNSLVQVINNMISNAIQSYNGTPNKNIDLLVNKQDNNIIISIQDYGSGMTKDIQDKLFKEMITTKGKNGTGLGMFMSYSTIRGHFNGNITFESKINKGTKFNVILPIS